jgi:alkanesulfonate monooxygenase SsuD/methylene tetrahydromethanopterin reductase-like flavin-dependent oxidoreductase (luciferase family)
VAPKLDFGIFTEFHCPPGLREADAFDESMAQALAAESYGFDAVWLAEIHFQKDRSVLSSPLVIGSAIAARTTRLKIGIAVQVLPLSHPLHLAEDVATLDHLSKGRVDFGVGRSGLPGHYQGFNISYDESRERFLETLEILIKAWTQERFSHDGRFYQYRDVCIMPKPFQTPHPPIRVAATTDETYPMVGRMGFPAFVAVRTSALDGIRRRLPTYQEAWRAAGHPGRGPVGLSLPMYVAETSKKAREEAEASTMHFFRSISKALQLRGDGATGITAAAREERSQKLREISYEEVLDQYAVYGSPEEVADRLAGLREELGLTTISAWMNTGSQIPHERVLTSMRLVAERVIPRLA